MQKKLLSVMLSVLGLVCCFSLNTLAQCPPSGVQGTYSFIDPAPTATDCSVFTQSEYTVWSNENYQVGGVVAGQTYVVSICDATGWNIVLGVYDPSDVLVASDDGTASGCGTGAQVSFTAPVDGTYSITVGTADCVNNQEANGSILIFNNSDGVDCPQGDICVANPGWVDVVQPAFVEDPIPYCADDLGLTPAEETLYFAIAIGSDDTEYNVTATAGTTYGSDGVESSTIPDLTIGLIGFTQAEVDANPTVTINFEGATMSNCTGELTLDFAALGITSISEFCGQCVVDPVWVSFDDMGTPVIATGPDAFCADDLGFDPTDPTIYIPVAAFSDGTVGLNTTSGSFVVPDDAGVPQPVTEVESAAIAWLTLTQADIDASATGIATMTFTTEGCTEGGLELDFTGFNITEFCVPDTMVVVANDDCSGAIDISDAFGAAGGETASIGPFSNVDATPSPNDGSVFPVIDESTVDGDGNCCFCEIALEFDTEYLHNDVWFTFTVPTSGDYAIEAPTGTTCGGEPLGVFEDTQIMLFTGECGALTFAGCNEDGPSATAETYPAGGTFALEAGVTYYLMVDEFNGPVEGGEFCLEVTNLAGADCMVEPTWVGVDANGGAVISADPVYFCGDPGTVIVPFAPLTSTGDTLFSISSTVGNLVVFDADNEVFVPISELPLLNIAFVELTQEDIDANTSITVTMTGLEDEACTASLTFDPSGTNVLELCPPEVDCPDLGLNIGDACDDGNGTVSADCVCDPNVDCPGLGNIGDPCDDGDPMTENDMVIGTCECVGELIDPNCPADAGDTNFADIQEVYCGPTDILATAAGFLATDTEGNNYLQGMVLTDADSIILEVILGGEATFSVDEGNYIVHSLNLPCSIIEALGFDCADPPLALLIGLAAGDFLGLADCFDLASSIPFAVVPADSPECVECLADGGTISTESATTVVSNDGIPDIVTVALEGNVGENYAYVITNEDATIMLNGPLDGPDFDFEGAPPGVCLIWGLAYDGEVTLGAPNEALSIEGDCFSLSNPIAVTREAEDTTCNANGGTISTTSETTVCVGDGTEDDVVVDVTGNAGENYVYLITNEDATILLAGPLAGPTFGFDGAPPGVCLIWGLAYDGEIAIGDEGAPLSLDGDCFSLSNPIEVVREDCMASLLEVVGLNALIDGDNQTYVITFNVEGGSGVYSSAQGTFEGTAFTSNPVPCGETYEFTIVDATTGVTEVVTGDSPDCAGMMDCNAEVGVQVGDTPDLTIDPGAMSEAWTFEGFTADEGYIFVYVLTTDLDCSDNTTGYNILTYNTTGIFDFSTPELQFEGGGIGPGCYEGGGLYNVYVVSFFGTEAEFDAVLATYPTGEELEDAIDAGMICADMPSLGDTEEGAYSIFIIPPCDANAGNITTSSVDDYVCGGEPTISFEASGFNADATLYAQAYVLTLADADLTIVDISTSGTFSTPATGEYIVHSLNVLAAEIAGLDLTTLVGQSAVAVLGTLECFDRDESESFIVLEPIEVVVDYNCDNNSGTYTLTVSFSGGLPAWAEDNGGDPEDYFYTASGDLNGTFDSATNQLLENADNSPYSITVTDEIGCSASASGTPPACTKTAVEFLGLNGRVEANGNYLYWSTASEENNDFFQVERSLDGVNFEPIGKVEGVGNSHVANDYHFTDVASPAGTAIYRLSIVDNDGKVDLTNTVTLTRDHEGFGITHVAPVPANDFLNVFFNGIAGTTTVSVFDVTGKEISRQEVETENGLNNITLSVETYSAGVYFLNITNGTNTSIEKFIVD